jgi:hypothetical protein
MLLLNKPCISAIPGRRRMGTKPFSPPCGITRSRLGRGLLRVAELGVVAASRAAPSKKIPGDAADVLGKVAGD